MTGYQKWDDYLKENYKETEILDRAIFYTPSEQHQFFCGCPKKDKPLELNWIKANDPAQKPFDKPFQEITSADLSMYSLPPRSKP